MKKRSKLLKALSVGALCACALVLPVVFSGCDDNQVCNSIVSIIKTGHNGLVDTYTITYSNGTTSTFEITNGRDGQNASLDDVWERYHTEYPSKSYSDFLKEYLTLSSTDNSKIINDCIQSSLKVYTEFKTSTLSSISWGSLQYTNSVSIMCGSAIIYQMNDDFSYVLTNYHVVYNGSANEDNGGKIASKITGYLYGSESEPSKTKNTDAKGYPIFDYGDLAINFTYVGGSIEYDIAVLKVSTDELTAVNPTAKAVTLAENYHVGETAIAIGNPENEGISVTQGIVSVDNEYIALQIGSEARSYRSIRIDTAIYGGSSGGGLFNAYGELIGITNAGDSTDQNINYAIPLEVVREVTQNILHYYDGSNPTTAKKIALGITVSGSESKYFFDTTTGYGKIKETITIDEVKANSIAKTLGLQQNDIIKAITINGTTYNLDRYFEIGDILLTIMEDDEISIKYVRNNVENLSTTYTILASDIK